MEERELTESEEEQNSYYLDAEEAIKYIDWALDEMKDSDVRNEFEEPIGYLEEAIKIINERISDILEKRW